MSNNPTIKSSNRAHELQLEPFAVRPKTLSQLEDCCLSEIYKRLNAGEYETYLDGAARMITMRSVRACRERLAATASQPHTKPSKAPGRPGRSRRTA
jgi:hypothetical protein